MTRRGLNDVTLVHRQQVRQTSKGNIGDNQSVGSGKKSSLRWNYLQFSLGLDTVFRLERGS